MKQLIGFFLVGMLLISACGSLEQEEGVEVHDARARAAPQGDNSAVYLLLHNHTPQEDELIGASTDAAQAVELHESKIDSGGVMTMELQSSIPLAPDAEIQFSPGGFHFMLVGLRKELKVGDEIILTLHFSTHEDVTFPVPVMNAMDMDEHGTP